MGAKLLTRHSNSNDRLSPDRTFWPNRLSVAVGSKRVVWAAVRPVIAYGSLLTPSSFRRPVSALRRSDLRSAVGVFVEEPV
jgi:hypothetical protein